MRGDMDQQMGDQKISNTTAISNTTSSSTRNTTTISNTIGISIRNTTAISIRIWYNTRNTTAISTRTQKYNWTSNSRNSNTKI